MSRLRAVALVVLWLLCSASLWLMLKSSVLDVGDARSSTNQQLRDSGHLHGNLVALVTTEARSVHNVSYHFSTRWTFSDVDRDTVCSRIIHGPHRFHVVCAVICRNESVVVRVAWDNIYFPQHREEPFLSSIRDWATDSGRATRLTKDFTACFFLQDDLGEVSHETADGVIPQPHGKASTGRRNSAELAGNVEGSVVPLLSNLLRPGVASVAIPDHTFSTWAAARFSLSFDQFYQRAARDDQFLGNRLPFAQRIEKVFWRGQSTAAGSARGNAGIGRRRLVREISQHSRLRRWFDVAFVSVYSDGQNRSRGYVALEDHAAYRFVLDLPGYGYSGRTKYLFLLGSLVLVVSHPEVEYWMPFFCPWVHFVPIRRDLLDLEDTLKILLAHPSVAESIASAGRENALLHFSRYARHEYLSGVLEAYAQGRGVEVTGHTVHLAGGATTSSNRFTAANSCLAEHHARTTAVPLTCRGPGSANLARWYAEFAAISQHRAWPNTTAASGDVEINVLPSLSMSISRFVESLPSIVRDETICFSFHSAATALPSSYSLQMVTVFVGSRVSYVVVKRYEALIHVAVCKLTSAPRGDEANIDRRRRALCGFRPHQALCITVTLDWSSHDAFAAVRSLGNGVKWAAATVEPSSVAADRSTPWGANATDSFESGSPVPIPCHSFFDWERQFHDAFGPLGSVAANASSEFLAKRRDVAFWRERPPNDAAASDASNGELRSSVLAVAAARMLLGLKQSTHAVPEVLLDVAFLPKNGVGEDDAPLQRTGAKFVFHIPGYRRGSLKYDLLCGAVVIIVGPRPKAEMEFWELDLVPWEHFVPVDFSFRTLAGALRNLSANNFATALRIHRQARQFVLSHLHPDGVLQRFQCTVVS